MNDTINYYDKNAERYNQETFDVNLASLQYEFLLRIPDKGKILDLGCGSGRDSKFFMDRGYEVIAVDGSSEMCKLAEKNIGHSIICSDLLEYEPQEPLAGIWANASLLHLTSKEIKDTVTRLTKHLLPVGCFYMSFKYGNFSGERDGRFYTDMDETSFRKMLDDAIPELSLVNKKISYDVRPNHANEKWLNIFCVKESSDTAHMWENKMISDEYFVHLCETGTFDEILKAVNNGANLGLNITNILRKRFHCRSDEIFAIERNRKSIGNRLIFPAVKAHDAEAVKILVKLGVQIHEFDQCENNTPLTLAVEQGDIEIVKIMLEEDRCYYEKFYREYVLINAVKRKNLDIIKLLVNHGANIELKGECGYSAFGIAIEENAIDIIDFFLSVCNLNTNELFGAFCYATLLENYELAEKFWKENVKIKHKGIDRYGILNKAILMAASHGDIDFIGILLHYGANPNAMTYEGLEELLEKFYDKPEIVRFTIRNCDDDLFFMHIFEKFQYQFQEELSVYLDED